MKEIVKELSGIKNRIIGVAKEIDEIAAQISKVERKNMKKKTTSKKVYKPHTAPDIGKVFTKKYKKKEYRMKVVKRADGIGYKVGNKVYHSPSSAARSITKYKINGWTFWSM